MTITQTVEIPADRRITLEVPRDIPTGKVILTFTPAQANVKSSEKSNLEETTSLVKRHTPRADKLLGVAEGLGDVDFDEIRFERLSKHLV